MTKKKNIIKNFFLVILAVALIIGCSLLSAAAAGGSGGSSAGTNSYGTVILRVRLNGGYIQGGTYTNTSGFKFKKGTWNSGSNTYNDVIYRTNSSGDWIDYISKITSSNDPINPTDVSTMGARRTGYHIDGDEAFIRSGVLFSQKEPSQTSNVMSRERLEAGTNTSSTYNRMVNINWKINTLTIRYHSGGATENLKTGTTPNELLETKVVNYNATTFSTSGISNANSMNGTWYLKKNDYYATNMWHVGSPDSSTVINANDLYATSQDLATAMGKDLGAGNVTVDLYPDWATPEMIAEFDSSTGQLRIYENVAIRYTDGQTIGTKTYYTGIEDITGETSPKWFANRASVTSVVIEDEFAPKTAYSMFCGMTNLTSITGISNLDTSSVTNMARMFFGCSNLTSLDLSSFDTSNVTNINSMFNDCSSLTSLDVSNFDTGNVTNINSMFNGCSSLTSLDLSSFDTGNVTGMSGMFRDCTSLTSLDISSFDTGNVTNMAYMFDGCSSLTSLDVSNFDTGNVTTMDSMFSGCSNLTSLDLSSFDTGNVTGMYNMFDSCTSLTSLDVSSFDTSNVTDMESMFSGCSSLTSLDLSSFDTSNVTDILYIFRNCTSLNKIALGPDSTFTVNPPNTGWTRYKTLDGTALATSNTITNISDYDGSAPGWYRLGEIVAEFDLSNGQLRIFQTTDTYTDGQIDGTKTYYTGLENIINDTDPKWHSKRTSVTNVVIEDEFAPKTAYKMFEGMSNLIFITGMSNLNTSNVTNMTSMFSGCSNLTSLDVSNFDTSNVTTMMDMFNNCDVLEDIALGPNSIFTVNPPNTGWKQYKALDGTAISNGASITNISDYDGSAPGWYRLGKVIAEFDSSNGQLRIFNTADTYTDGQVVGTKTYYTGIEDITGNNYPKWYTNRLSVTSVMIEDEFVPKTAYNMFRGMIHLTSITGISNLDTSNVEDMSYMFYDCRRLTSLDVSNFDTSNVEDMSYMFEGCSSLTSLDVSNFDTSNVEDMSYMFESCSSLTSLDVSNFDTSNVEDMSYMFESCSSLTSLDVSNIDTGNVTDMGHMFSYCSNLTSLDLSNFDTGNVIKMWYMFRDCESLTSLDLSNFDTGNVTHMTCMFYGCSDLTSLDLSSFDTGNVTDMEFMFASCSSLTSLDLSSFDTSHVTTMDGMFEDCSSLTSLDLSSFNTSNVRYMPSMFKGCSSLTSLDLSSFDTSNVTYMYNMFYGCSSLTSLDLSSFNTSNVTTMNRMFYNCSDLTSLDLSSFDTGSVTEMTDIFGDCNALNNIALGKNSIFTVNPPNTGWTRYKTLDGTALATSNTITNISDYDGSAPGWYRLGEIIAEFDSSNGQLRIFRTTGTYTNEQVVGTKTYYTGIEGITGTMNPKWYANRASVTSVVIEDEFAPKTANHMFYGMTNLTSITGISNLDTSNVITMSYMFMNCSSLTSLDLSSFDTSNVTDMTYMFAGCDSLTSLDLSSFDTSNVTGMSGMFRDCTSLTSLDISSFDTSNVRNKSGMFNGCTSLNNIALGPNSIFTVNPPNTGWKQYKALDGTAISNGVSIINISDYDGSAPGWYRLTTSFTITFHPSGGTFGGTTDNSTLSVNSGATDNNNPGVAVREGYAFKGWFTLSAGGDQVYDDDGRFVVGTFWTSDGKWNYSSDLDLYAHWEDEKGTLRYHNNGHGEEPGNTSMRFTTETSVKDALSETGWIFKGWNTQADGKGTMYEPGSVYKEAESLENVDGVTVLPDGADLYAVWEEMKGTLSYDRNGHGEVPEDATLWFTKEHKMPTVFDVEGYTFINWNTKANGKGADYIVGSVYKKANKLTREEDNATVIPGNTKVYAIWREITGTLKFDANGHGTDPEDLSMRYSQEAKTRSMDNVEGWIFLGWATSKQRASQEIVDYAAKAKVKNANSLYSILDEDHPILPNGLTLYAVWIQDEGDLVYDSQGHGTAPEAIHIRYSKEATVATDTMKEYGWTFKEWNTKADGTGYSFEPGAAYKEEGTFYNVKNEKVIPSGDTLYAIWIENTATLTYDFNYEGAPESVTSTMRFTQVENIRTQVPVRGMGFTFKEWNTGKYGKGTGYAPGDVYKNANVDPEDRTLYAVWIEETATLTYDANGHGTAPDSETLYYSKEGRINGTMSNPGFVFLGWNTKADGTGTLYQKGDLIKNANASPRNITLYATWQQERHTMTVEANGGKFSGNKISVSYTMTVNSDEHTSFKNNMPSLGGKTCTGLYTRKIGGAKIFDENGKLTNDGTFFKDGVFIYNSDFTLYAQWGENQVKCVVYDKNTDDPVSNMPIEEYKFLDKPITLSNKIPTREGYTFVYWSTDPAGAKGDAYYVQNGTGSVFPVDSDNAYDNYESGPVTLYAQWQQNGKESSSDAKLDVKYNIYDSDATNGLLDAEIVYNYRNLFMQNKEVSQRRTIFVDSDQEMTPQLVIADPTWTENDPIPGFSYDPKPADPTPDNPVNPEDPEPEDKDYVEVSSEEEINEAIKNFDYTSGATLYLSLTKDIALTNSVAIPLEAIVEIDLEEKTLSIAASTMKPNGTDGTAALTVLGDLTVGNGTISAADSCVSICDMGNFTALADVTLSSDATYAVFFEKGAGTATATLAGTTVGNTDVLCGTQNQFSTLTAKDDAKIGSDALYADFTNKNANGLVIENAYTVADPTNHVDDIDYTVIDNNFQDYNYRVIENEEIVNCTVITEVEGDGYVNGTGDYRQNTNITLEAVPHEGSRFVRWINANGDTVSTKASWTFKLTSDMTVTALFELIPHDIDVETTDSTMGTVEGGGTYGETEQATITATPKTGYVFTGWKKVVDGEPEAEFESTNAEYTFTVTEDALYMAYFDKVQYTLHIDRPEYVDEDACSIYVKINNEDEEELNISGDYDLNGNDNVEIRAEISDDTVDGRKYSDAYTIVGWIDSELNGDGSAEYLSTTDTFSYVVDDNLSVALVLNLTDDEVNRVIENFKETQRNRIESEFTTYAKDYLNKAQPIGSVYTTTDESLGKGDDYDDSTSPDYHIDKGVIAIQDQLGGKWERVENTFLKSAANGEEVGTREGRVKYKLSLAMTAGSGKFGYVPGSISSYLQTPSLTEGKLYSKFSRGTSSPSGNVIVTDEEQLEDEIEFMPPYQSVYVFRRVDEFEGLSNITDNESEAYDRCYWYSMPSEDILHEGYIAERLSDPSSLSEDESMSEADISAYNKGYRVKIVEKTADENDEDDEDIEDEEDDEEEED